jgi:hypothetical protein
MERPGCRNRCPCPPCNYAIGASPQRIFPNGGWNRHCGRQPHFKSAQALPFAGLGTGMFRAASTSLSEGRSGASGQPVTGVIHTCIIGSVTSLTLPASHDELESVLTSEVPLWLKQRFVWICHCVSRPPGCGGVRPFWNQVHGGRRHSAADRVDVHQGREASRLSD